MLHPRYRLYNPSLITETPRHAEVYTRYEHLYAWADALAATAFVIGSVFFLIPDLKEGGAWLFLIGSVLFAVVPLTKHLQAVHMRKLSTGSEPDQSSSRN